jgi:hypothetical protein
VRSYHSTSVDLRGNFGVWEMAAVPLRNAGEIGWRGAQRRRRRPVAPPIRAVARTAVLHKILLADVDSRTGNSLLGPSISGKAREHHATPHGYQPCHTSMHRFSPIMQSVKTFTHPPVP